MTKYLNREIEPFLDKALKSMPVVVLTGQGTEELYQEFLSKGASGYLTKDDYFIDTLIDTINKVLI